MARRSTEEVLEQFVDDGSEFDDSDSVSMK